MNIYVIYHFTVIIKIIIIFSFPIYYFLLTENMHMFDKSLLVCIVENTLLCLVTWLTWILRNCQEHIRHKYILNVKNENIFKLGDNGITHHIQRPSSNRVKYIKLPLDRTGFRFRRIAVLHSLPPSFSYITQLRLYSKSELSKLFVGKSDSWQLMGLSLWSSSVIDLNEVGHVIKKYIRIIPE